jgi:DNA-binding beta-propeller fold protein YncE
MSLKHVADVALPPHAKPGGFDHAAVHSRRSRVYVAHTANDAIDVLDGTTFRYLDSIPGLPAVAGALVAEPDDLVFTSNRGENTVGIFHPGDAPTVTKVGVGVRPNGLAYDAERGLLLAANVGDAGVAASFTVSIVDVSARTMLADVPVPGRTRWTVYDPIAHVFYVNIMEPASIVVIEAGPPARIARVVSIPVAGPHGLDLDVEARRLYCACDGGQFLAVAIESGAIMGSADLSGVPDVVFLNATLRRVYVAVGDPGVIDVFDADTLRRLESVATEPGAHTIGFDPARHTVYAFLPQSHRAAVYTDHG